MLKRFAPLLLLSLAACSHETRAIHHRPIQIPLLYLPGVAPITVAERRQFESHIPPGMPPVWFILIADNTPAKNVGGAPQVGAETFFIPDRQAVIHSPKITPIPGVYILRQGRYLPLSSPSGAPILPLTYLQVPYSDRAPNPVLLPTLPELPFPRPASTPDDTIVELILLARSTYAAHDIPPNSPILAINHSSVFPNAYLVQVAASPGQTRTLTLRQFNGYFTIDP